VLPLLCSDHPRFDVEALANHGRESLKRPNAKKMKLPKFDYASPTTIDEAVALLSRADGTARVIAGGQSLMPMLAFRLVQPSLLVDLRHIPGLDAIAIKPDGVHLGAKVRWCDIEASTELATAHPLVKAAVRNVAHHQIRTRGTVGGSLAHADPAAEMPCVAALCDAEIQVVGPDGERKIPATSFFTGPLMTALESDEIITGIRLPSWPKARRWAFDEFAMRRGDFALGGIGLHFDLNGSNAKSVHIAAFGVGDTPVRLTKAEAAVEGRELTEAVIKSGCESAQADIDPKDDIHGSSAYRRALIGHLLEKALRHSINSPGKASVNAD
jgi:carbon-monoxide dehydrogenase medium subunit